MFYTCLLQLKNGLSNSKVTLKVPFLKTIINGIEKHGFSYWENYDEDVSDIEKNKICLDLIKLNETDTEIIGDIINSTLNGKIELMMETLSRYGYSHTTDKITPEIETITHYIIYDVNAITIQKTEKIL